MNFKFSFFILVLSLLLMSCVWADDDVTITYDNFDEFDNDVQLTYDGVSFTIPEGYGVLKNTSLEDVDFWQNVQFMFFGNTEGNTISVNVISSWFGVNLDDIVDDGDVKKTVCGHEGYLKKDDEGVDFKYIDDGKGVYVQTDDMATLKKVIG